MSIIPPITTASPGSLTSGSPQAYSSFTLDPGGRNTQPTFQYAFIRQGNCQHDQAVVRCRGLSPDVPELSTGTPVSLTYGWNPFQLRTFVGYVSHYRPEDNFQLSTVPTMMYTDVICIGASFVFKDMLNGIWPNTQASTVVSSIASNQMFSTQTENTDIPWPMLASSGMSGWKFFAKQADRLGWILACNETNLRFMSSGTAIKMASENMPVFYSVNAAPNANYQGISSFEVQQGETIGLDGATRSNRYVSNIDSSTGVVFTVQNDSSDIDYTAIAARVAPPFVSRQETDIIASTQATAQQYLDATAQKNRYHIKAEAVVTGDTSVVQGSPVLLLGLGVNSSGVWLVEEVEHRLEKGKYTMKLQLGRDATGDTGFRPSQPSYVAWSTTIPLNSVPKASLVQGRWRAQHASNEIVGG